MSSSSGQELERADGQAGAVALASNVAEAGVSIIERDGVRVVSLPDNLRERFNVLLPVSEIVQANPLWTPGVRAVNLSLAEHTYRGSKNGFKGLNKYGVLLLARTAGVEVVSTDRMERSRLKDSEIGWQATVRVRTADGTWQHVTESRVMDLDEERMAIDHQVRSSEATYAERDGRAMKPEAALKAAVVSRWTNERPHYDAKCETKAVLRAVRHVVGIPQEYPEGAFSKPWLVVSYNLTPDYSDPETLRYLLADAVGATQRAFPAPRVQGELPPTPTALEPGEAQEAAPATEETAKPSEPDVVPAASVPASAAPAPDTDAKRAEASRYPIAMGKHKGKTIGSLAAEGDEGLGYLRWLDGREATTHDGRMLKSMIHTYLTGDSE